MSARQFRTAAIPTLILLAGGALLVLQLSGGGRLRAANSGLPPSNPDMMTRVIATHAPLELVDQRDDHTRVWEVVRDIETTHPDGSTTVDTVKSQIHEKGSGLCYKDATGNYIPVVAEWRETPEGFVIDRCAYGLAIGKKIGAGMGYNVEGHELALRPAYLMASDGVNEADLAVLNPDAEGFIVDGKPSVVRFPAAFGPGYDLEYVAEKGGFHQNLIIAAPPQLPAGFDAGSATIYLYTEINLDEYLAASGRKVSIEGQPVNASAADFISAASRGGSISFRLAGRDAGELGRRLHAFGVSKVTDSPTRGGIPKEILADKRLMKDPLSGMAYLVESLPSSFLLEDSPAYPVLWDYETINSDITTNATWEGEVTYWVSASISVTATLTIEEGAIVKLNPYTKISISEGGKVIAEGEPPDYIVFTKAADDDYGEQIQAPDGQYMTALQLVSGSQPGSVVQYCNMRYGVCGVDCLQSLNNPIAHNVLGANEAQRDMWFGINVQYGVDVPSRNNLIRSCTYYGIYYYQASADDIRNNTVHDCGCGINLTYTACPGVRDNLLTSCTTGIGANYGSLSVDYNGYWDCQTNISGKSMGANSVDLGDDEQDNPYAEEGEFLLDQSCALIGAGSRSARYAGLNDCSTSATADRDVRDLDIGYHYPHGYFEDTDQDGMPDVWEDEWELDPEDDSDADSDGDNDDLSNLDEYLNGTLPNDSNSDDDDLDDGEEVMRGGGARDWNFPRGPYLHLAWDGDDVEMVVRWTTASSQEGAIRYRQETGDWTDPVEEGESKEEHEVSTGPLELNTLYFYEVGWMKEGTTYERQYGTRHFWTPPTGATDFQFIVYGDNRGGNDENFREQHAKVVAGILEQTLDPRFVIHVGDLVHDGGEEGQWNPQFFWPAQPLLEIAPLFPCLGNHEYYGDSGANYKAYFTLPAEYAPSDPKNERWYSFDYGDCHFICLDVYNVSDFDNEADDQREWLATDLAGASGQRLFVWFHNPPFSSGPHGSNQQTLDNGRYVRQHLVPIFQYQGVNMVFSGHDHIYERAACTYLGNTIRYVVTGGGGAPLADGIHDYDYPEPPTRPLGQTTAQEALYAQNWHPGQADNITLQFCLLRITTSSCQLLMYKWDGTLKDEWP